MVVLVWEILGIVVFSMHAGSSLITLLSNLCLCVSAKILQIASLGIRMQKQQQHRITKVLRDVAVVFYFPSDLFGNVT